MPNSESAGDVRKSWNERYASGECGHNAPDPILIEAARIAAPGRALDLACGLGRHAIYLAERGWHVTAVDNSEVAIKTLTELSPQNVEIILADLERQEYEIVPDSFDLIIGCLYLQRSLFPAIRAGVRPGGLFAGAFAMEGINPAFLAAPGEIRGVFADWELLNYGEADGRATILARRPREVSQRRIH